MSDAEVFDSQTAAEDACRALAPDAIELTAIAAAADATLHSLFLDETRGRVLWAYREPDEDVWQLDILPAALAAERIDGQLAALRDAVDDPWSSYATVPPGRVNDDLDALDEAHMVAAAGITTAAAAVDYAANGGDLAVYVDMVLKEDIERARRALAHAAARRAEVLRRRVPAGHGGQAALARRLGISPQSLGEILRRDVTWREEIRRDAAEARADDDDLDGE